jgi:small neutral amino acid transporter SnatA (MarC family)
MAWRTFGQSFVTLLVILDPLGNIPLFLALTSLGMLRGAESLVVTPGEHRSWRGPGRSWQPSS